MWRASIPKDQGRNSMAYSDLALEVTHCHIHCILLITSEPLRLVQIQGRGIRPSAG